jgi:hypothetical protein
MGDEALRTKEQSCDWEDRNGAQWKESAAGKDLCDSPAGLDGSWGPCRDTTLPLSSEAFGLVISQPYVFVWFSRPPGLLGALEDGAPPSLVLPRPGPNLRGARG